MASAIEVRELTKEFEGPRALPWSHPGSRTLALDRASFDVGDGEIYALIGPNGAGKTTLLKILSTILLPTSGSARILGYDVVDQEAEARSRLALVTNSERSFYYRLSGWENLRFFCGLYNMDRRTVEEAARPVARRLGLDDAVLRRDYRTYSTGTQRKLQFLRAFILDTPVLFLDEPTSSLDPVSAEEVRAVIATECRDRGQTVVLSANNLVDVERLADRVAMIHRGRLEVIGFPPSREGARCARIILRADEATALGVAQRWRRTEAGAAVREIEAEERAGGTVVLRFWAPEPTALVPSLVEAFARERIRVDQIDLRPVVLEEEFLRRVDAGAEPEEAVGP
ncbi:MAG: ABC transporter ATP-binding protein [Thermoplasmata archaeon]